MRVVGLDIGGANLKAATADGDVLSSPFEIWRTPDRLTDALTDLLAKLPAADALAVTMTAELADCFRTKAEGVDFVLAAAERVAGTRAVHVWSTEGRFVSPCEARRDPMRIAAANWHALATWGAQRFLPTGCGLLVDIGSTTTDIIPLRDGRPVATGLTDGDRLLSGELVYTGIRRTPLCAVASEILFRGQPGRVAAELFATTLDVYLLLEDVAEDFTDYNTANGRPATRVEAWHRMARMLCRDGDEFSVQDAIVAARQFAAAQQTTIARVLNQVLTRLGSPPESVIVSGSGSFLARRVLESDSRTRGADIISLDAELAPAVAESACAFAVATLLLQ
jgi:probable H4MPT-linked C1 transfer pathway protein